MLGQLVKGFGAIAPHSNLAQRDREVLGERALDLLGDARQGGVEAEAGFDTGSDHVEGVGQALDDLGLPAAGRGWTAT